MNKSLKFRFSYHWLIFIVGFMMVFTALGFGSSTGLSYKSAIIDDVDTGLTDVFFYGFAPSFRHVTTAILNIFFGFFVAKFGPRKLIGFGFSALTIACICNSFATEYWHIYLGHVFLGIGFAWTTTTIVSTIVEKWFTNGKGTVMGIILAANGLGGALSEVIINPMCNEVGNLGWRTAYRITAVLFFAVGIVSVLLIRNQPSDLGLRPLGEGMVAKKKRGADWDGFDMETVRKKPYFYICGLCIFLTGAVLTAMSSASKVHIYDVVGKSDEMVAWVSLVFVFHSLVLMASKIFAGFSFDRFGIRFTFGYCSVAAVISLLSLHMMTTETTWLAWFYSVLSSVALPLETILIPLLVFEIFGKKSHAKIMGYYLGLNVFGYAVGGPLADFFYGKFHSYRLILLVFAVLMTLSALAIQFTFVKAKKDRIAFEQYNT